MSAVTQRQDVFILEDYHLVPETAAEQQIRPYVLIGLLALVVLIGGSVFWAMRANLDGAVVAPASLVVEGNWRTVQHLDGGIVRELLVADGEFVEAGQTLLQLDSTDTEVDINVLGSQLGGLSLRRARLKAQLAGDTVFPQNSADIASMDAAGQRDWRAAYETQRQLFETELRARQSEDEIVAKRIESLFEEIEGIAEQRAANARQTTITEGEVAALTSLLEKGLVSKRRVNAIRIEIERLLGQDASLQTAQARAKNQIGELKLEAITAKKLRDETITAELAAVETQLASVMPQYLAAVERKKRISIVAPASGRVVNLSVFTEGAVIRPGAAILDVVPSEDELIVEARIDTTDIEKLRVGQDTRVRLTAFDQEQVPEASGRIVDISADSLTDERTGGAYFVARVQLDATQPDTIAQLDLIPGMPADIFVNTGERSAFSYLAKPLSDRIARAFID
ncbi:MAG: HlyD family type I secretion periplasmic adaptor subunit [Pseudomonadota bacterium]